jgi:hypothetical protein
MKEAEITREQLIGELQTLCKRLAQLESSTTYRVNEFNNALTVVLGYAELALYDVPPDSVIWHHLQQVVVAGKRVQEVAQKLL